MRRCSSRAVTVGVALAVATSAAVASAAPGGTAGKQVPLFSISKSENKNRVQYVVRVDERCAPVATAPVGAYWLMLEEGPSATEPLLEREQKAYGIASQRVLSRGPEGGTVRFSLRALPDRSILVRTGWADGKCIATSTVSIGGTPAYLFNVHAALSWPVGVDYLLLSGWSTDRTRVVREKIER